MPLKQLGSWVSIWTILNLSSWRFVYILHQSFVMVHLMGACMWPMCQMLNIMGWSRNDTQHCTSLLVSIGTCDDGLPPMSRSITQGRCFSFPQGCLPNQCDNSQAPEDICNNSHPQCAGSCTAACTDACSQF